jgi:hypothetical protein
MTTDPTLVDEYWGLMVFGVGVLLMGIGKCFKHWFGS